MSDWRSITTTIIITIITVTIDAMAAWWSYQGIAAITIIITTITITATIAIDVLSSEASKQDPFRVLLS
jgi:hypothetical protein